MFRRPTVGLLRPSTSRAYTEPRCAKPTSSRASQSTLAPPSTTRTGWPALGKSAPIAARCTPGCRRNSSVLAASTAPVLPAETNRDGGARLAADRGQGLVTHADHFGGIHDLDARAICGAAAPERGFDVRLASDQLDLELGRQLLERLRRALHFHLRGVVTSHRVQRDADHQSSTVTRCSPS